MNFSAFGVRPSLEFFLLDYCVFKPCALVEKALGFSPYGCQGIIVAFRSVLTAVLLLGLFTYVRS